MGFIIKRKILFILLYLLPTVTGVFAFNVNVNYIKSSSFHVDAFLSLLLMLASSVLVLVFAYRFKSIGLSAYSLVFWLIMLVSAIITFIAGKLTFFIAVLIPFMSVLNLFEPENQLAIVLICGLNSAFVVISAWLLFRNVKLKNKTLLGLSHDEAKSNEQVR